MNFTRTTTRRMLKLTAISAAVLLISAYAALKLLDYVRGPEIEVTSPPDGAASSSPTVAIIGRAERITAISLNGRPISMDEKGNFDEIIALFPGINFVTLDARDRFDRTIQKRLQLVGEP